MWNSLIFIPGGVVLVFLSFFLPDSPKHSIDANWIVDGILMCTGFIFIAIGIAVGVLKKRD